MATQDSAGVDSPQRIIDGEHLRLLAVCHFISGGLAALCVLFVTLHFAVFHYFFSHPEFWDNGKQVPIPPQVFAMMKWVYAFFFAWFVMSAAANIASAVCLRRRRYRTFSIVVAAINCIYIPMGTILGVFTIVVLSRGSVVKLYEA